MYRTFRRWLIDTFGNTTNRHARRRDSVVLEVEPLEDRLAPVVGRNVIPAPVLPGSPYDGVALLIGRAQVNLGGGNYNGTGSLIQMGDGHYILTVAHNNPTGAFAKQAIFNLQRNGTPVDIFIPIPDNVPGGNQFAINNPNYQGTALDSIHDIALWKLVDPLNRQPNRLLVAPYGAQQYQLYTDFTAENNEVGRQVNIVGYGETGVGAYGVSPGRSLKKRTGTNTIDTIGTTLRNQVERIQFAGEGNFQVGWRGQMQTTPNLTVGSTPTDILAALESIPAPAGSPVGTGPTHQNLPGFRDNSESAGAVQLKTKKPGA